MTISKLKRKGFILFTFPHHSLSLKDVMAGTPRDAVYWLALPSSTACFVKVPRTSIPEVMPPIVNGVQSHQSSFKKYLHRFAHMPV